MEEKFPFWGQVREVEEDLAPDGRVLVRPSGTEPLVRVMVEAASIERAELVADRLVESVVQACRGGTAAAADTEDRPYGGH